MAYSGNTESPAMYETVFLNMGQHTATLHRAAATVHMPQDMPMQALPSCTGHTLWEAPWQQAILEGSSAGACRMLSIACMRPIAARSPLKLTTSPPSEH